MATNGIKPVTLKYLKDIRARIPEFKSRKTVEDILENHVRPIAMKQVAAEKDIHMEALQLQGLLNLRMLELPVVQPAETKAAEAKPPEAKPVPAEEIDVIITIDHIEDLLGTIEFSRKAEPAADDAVTHEKAEQPLPKKKTAKIAELQARLQAANAELEKARKHIGELEKNEAKFQELKSNYEDYLNFMQSSGLLFRRKQTANEMPIFWAREKVAEDVENFLIGNIDRYFDGERHVDLENITVKDRAKLLARAAFQATQFEDPALLEQFRFLIDTLNRLEVKEESEPGEE
jgi:hypothetical protein